MVREHSIIGGAHQTMYRSVGTIQWYCWIDLDHCLEIAPEIHLSGIAERYKKESRQAQLAHGGCVVSSAKNMAVEMEKCCCYCWYA